jgi:DNA transposition AAA+ family ATPase
MNAVRAEGRQALHLYMSRTGLSLSDLASRMGYAHRTLVQFSSGARYGDGEGEQTAARIQAWIEDHPAPLPEFPGRLYPTEATKEMDALLTDVRQGAWGVLYGPSGAQKSFLLEYRAAEAAREDEPSLVYIRTSPSGMTATVLLRRIAAAIGAPYAQQLDGMRQQILHTIQRRRASLALVMDEADALYHWVETLETLREIGDRARVRPGQAGVGILVAGNERVMQIFDNRRGVYFEKWRARIEQQELRVTGPAADEAEMILRGELGEVKKATSAHVVECCTVQDPVSHKSYVNAHRLFNTIRNMQRSRGANGRMGDKPN